MFVPADSISLILFCILLVCIVSVFLFGVYYLGKSRGESLRCVQRNLAGLVGWFLFLGLIVYSGIVEKKPMPNLPLFVLAINAGAIGFAFSSEGKKLAVRTPVYGLILFQCFRLPLELILHSWVHQGVIPATMTWTGQNLDIVSGVTSLILGLFVYKNICARSMAWLANFVGSILLVNVIRVVIMSSPLPFAWQVSPPLLLIFHIPYFLILPICVSGALAGHIILTRALIRR